MPVNKKTNIGKIKISDDAIATLAGTTVNECYGIVGMTSKNYLKDGFSMILGKDNYSKGVVIDNSKSGLKIDLYVIISYQVKISEVVDSVQKRVRYELENALNIDIKEVNVFVEGVQVNG